jgi:hypothetical protein
MANLTQLRPRWLQYHDKDTGNLLGTLPLAIGMRMALTEHIDRSEDKQLLRGTVGIVHSWVWEEGRPRPSVVYIKFQGAKWQLDGTEEPGIYPVVPKRQEWHLDRRRKVKTLKVRRTQLPLSPAYAMTAHASQGKTLRAVLLDLQVDKRVDPTIGTVATTRVRSREDVLIMRPFPKFLFQRGPSSEGPDLLLKKLRGEAIDWAAFREAKRPCATCGACQQICQMDMYEQKQWELARANKPAMCKACKEGFIPKRRRKLDAESLQKHRCFGCDTNKIAEAFPRAQLVQENADCSRRCLKCVQIQRGEMECVRCTETKAQPDFEPEMVTMPACGVVCLACQEEVRQQKHRQWKGFFSCQTCAKVFSTSVAVGKNQARRCLNCSSRDTWKKGELTCRKPTCKRKWVEERLPGDDKRQRYCPDCRRA